MKNSFEKIEEEGSRAVRIVLLPDGEVAPKGHGRLRFGEIRMTLSLDLSLDHMTPEQRRIARKMLRAMGRELLSDPPEKRKSGRKQARIQVTQRVRHPSAALQG